MSERQIPAGLRQRTLAAARMAPGDLDRGRAPDGVPHIGELWTAVGPVVCEWLVVERDELAGGRLRVVPADLDPRLGGGDLAVVDSADGRLVLRCALAVWVDAGVFAAGQRTGGLPPADLERLQRWLAKPDESREPTWQERQTEAEPGYRALLAELEQARRELVESSDRPISEAQEVAAPVFARRWALAAAMLMALAVAFLLGRSVTLQPGEPPPARLLNEPLVDLPLVYFPAVGGLRGPARTVELPAAAQLCLLVAAAPQSPQERYRMEIIAMQPNQLIWSHPAIQPRAGELRLAVPVAMLPAGDYQLRILASGAGAAEPELLAEHRLRVVLESVKAVAP